MRYLGILRNTLLGGLGAWALGGVLEVLLNYEDGFCRVLLCIGLLGGALGSLFGRSRRWCFPAVMIAGVVISFVFLRRWEYGALYGLTAAVLSFLGAAAGGYGFYPPMGIFPGLLLILCALMTEGAVQLAAGIMGLLAFVLLLDGCRERSLRKGLFAGSGAPIGAAPAGLMSNSLVMSALFLLGALAAAAGICGVILLLWRLVSAVFAVLAGEAAEAYAWLDAWGDRFYEWFWSLFHREGPEMGERIVVIKDGEPLPGLVVAASTAMLVALITGGGAVVLGLMAAVAFRRRGSIRPTEKTVDYVDEVEWLERPKLRQWAKKRFQPKKHYQGAMQIRYAFQTMLLRRKQAGETVFYRTPNELRRQDPVENSLIDAYNRVRYSGAEPTAAELALAGRYIKK